MFWAALYLIIGGCLSAYVAGRHIEVGYADDRFAQVGFIIAGVFVWPILLPVFYAFRAGERRAK